MGRPRPPAPGAARPRRPTARAAVASETSVAEGDASGTTVGGTSDGSVAAGPTTTGPECEFQENSSLPLERCDMGPAVAVVQSVLQANGFAVDTIDGNFGDQTLYAVRAFQEDEGLDVDGIVGLQTWTALDVSQFGTDEDGDGVIEPDEIDLSE